MKQSNLVLSSAPRIVWQYQHDRSNGGYWVSQIMPYGRLWIVYSQASQSWSITGLVWYEHINRTGFTSYQSAMDYCNHSTVI